MMIRENRGENPFEFKSLSEADVKYVLEKINPKKSSGWDSRVPPKLLKLGQWNSTIINQPVQRLREAEREWKKGEWTPVFKKGSRTI